jgi:hypothetical protein
VPVGFSRGRHSGWPCDGPRAAGSGLLQRQRRPAAFGGGEAEIRRELSLAAARRTAEWPAPAWSPPSFRRAAGGLLWATPRRVVPLGLEILTHPADPGAAVGTPWSAGLTGSFGLYWANTVVLELLLRAWGRLGPQAGRARHPAPFDCSALMLAAWASAGVPIRRCGRPWRTQRETVVRIMEPYGAVTLHSRAQVGHQVRD